MMTTKIDTPLVRHLVSRQFPQWKDLPIYPVSPQGWDNKSFRLGTDMLIRMPSASEYVAAVEKEHKWLPRLAPSLPLLIPVPLALGEPDETYPWPWSIYRWIDGESAAIAAIHDLCDFAHRLAHFLNALQRIETKGGPLPGPHNFYRGGALNTYDLETREALAILKDKIDIATATEIWEAALETSWQNPPVWIHGDISMGNLLVLEGKLMAVIDFGGLAIGDPACDLTIAWTLFKGKSRALFRTMLPFDPSTWLRSRAWALWKALITAAGLVHTNSIESKQSKYLIDEVLAEYRQKK